MFGHQYYHQVLRKYVITFGNLFNDIIVQRFNSAGTRIQSIAVPIAYGPKEKFLSRINSNPDLDDDVAIQLPRMGFEMTGMTYDPTRKLAKTQQNRAIGTSNQNLRTQFNSAPYNIDFALSIFVKNADDGVQIIEQILPFFTPDFTPSVKLLPAMNLTFDIPVVLQSVAMEDAYEGSFEERRALVYTLNFTMKGYILGPVQTTGVIKRVQVDTHTDIPLDTARETRVVVTPGLLANGSPTTNSSASIATSLISANSDFGIAEDFFFYTDSRTYSPTAGVDSDE